VQIVNATSSYRWITIIRPIDGPTLSYQWINGDFQHAKRMKESANDIKEDAAQRGIFS
jgi:hypothetical protein